MIAGTSRCLLLAACIAITALLCALPAHAADTWKTLEPGLEYGTFPTSDTPDNAAAPLHILRIDPNYFDFTLLTAKERGVQRTAAAWVHDYNLLAAVNAGMFQQDGVTNVGFMRSPTHTNNPASNHYQSLFAFQPTPDAGAGAPRARLFDLDSDAFQRIAATYTGMVQNLRLIKRPGKNRWGQQPTKWSEVALGQDAAGRILFIFSRAPLSMHQFNNRLLALPLDLQCAQHLEGGPEASLVVAHPALRLSLWGSFETSFNENDGNPDPWPIPNVLGIVRRSP
ncbi:MAG: phosphodiester glycosidase family protein [Desulfovibrionaceae bacterium]